MSRLVKDANFIAATALPAGSTTNASTAFNLGASAFKPEEYELNLVVAANSVTDGSVAITLQDSADGATFAAIPGLAVITIPTANTAFAETIRLPSGVRQYLNVSQTGTGATIAAGGSSVMSLLF